MLGFGVLGFRGTLAVAVVVPSSSRVRYPIPFSKSVFWVLQSLLRLRACVCCWQVPQVFVLQKFQRQSYE